MRRLAASLAAALAALGLAACGGDGAEPDAPGAGAREATLVLDFQPNAVHAGIYAAARRGYFADEGLELTIREPSASTDAPKLLRSGRAELAILDIHDLAIARERGIDLVGVAAIVQRPLAAVIARDPEGEVDEPADLAGARVGVTGLPSDDAVLESVLDAGSLDPADVETVTIGFDSVAALSAGRVDAATAFWSAEGVALRDLGIETTEFRVGDYGAPSYPELVVVTTAELAAAEPERIESLRRGLRRGYGDLLRDPEDALADLLAAVPELDEEVQRRQLEALGRAFEPPVTLGRDVLEEWARWDAEHGIVDDPPDVDAAFAFGGD